MFKQEPDFLFQRDKRLLEIIKVEITRVDCIYGRINRAFVLTISGEVSVKGTLAVQNYTLTFLVKDQCDTSSTGTLTISVSDSVSILQGKSSPWSVFCCGHLVPGK